MYCRTFRPPEQFSRNPKKCDRCVERASLPRKEREVLARKEKEMKSLVRQDIKAHFKKKKKNNET
jgi:hypothetical protein